MSNVDAPATHRDLAALETRIDRRFDELMRVLIEQFSSIDQRFEKIDQRFEKIDQRFEKIDQRFEKIDQRLATGDRKIDGLEARLLAELAAHARAIDESVAQRIAVIDEAYRDLPGRVARLEEAVGLLQGGDAPTT